MTGFHRPKWAPRKLPRAAATGIPLAMAAILLPSLITSSTANAAETLLSYQKPTTASSQEDATTGSGLAVDGDAASRWASAEGADPQWIAVDLGGTSVVNRVKLSWEAAYASDYQVQLSSDGTTWKTIKTVTGGNGADDEITGLTGSGRHLRVLGTKRATAYGYSLWELEVYGSRTGGGDIQPPSTPTGLTAASSTSDTVTLNWAAATDNVGVTGYEVLRNGSVIGNSAANTFTDTNLASGTTFTYTVRARDAAGNVSSLSAPIQASTQPGNGSGTVLVIAGDIAKPELPSEHNKTADLVAGIKPSYVLTVGDNQYDNGTLSEYRNFYDKTWGKFKSITKPTPGNHEWNDQLKGYKSYFGAGVVAPGGKAYYSYDIGDFHFVAMDSDPIANGDVGDQVNWLRQDLAKNTKSCVVGYWHHPRWNSGQYGDDPNIAPLWDEMIRAKADIVFSGHDHHYERIKPLNSQGKVDEANGVRQAIVGIGGDSLYKNIKNRVGVEKSFAKHGVMKFVISGKTYSWEIIGIDGQLLDKAGPYNCR